MLFTHVLASDIKIQEHTLYKIWILFDPFQLCDLRYLFMFDNKA